MKQVDVERSQEFRKCIECFLCQDTCHVVRDHEENKEVFAGPRFFIRAAELDMHPLDAKTDRKNYAQREQGLGLCNITKCCTEVCPEHIKITDNAIIPMKERVVDNRYDPLVWLGRKIFRQAPSGTALLAPRGQLEDAAPAANLPSGHTAHGNVPDHVDVKVVPRGVVWHPAMPAGMEADVGPDGRMPLSEVTYDRAGAASPFGDNVTFPLPLGDLNYQHHHPVEDDDH